MFCSEVGCQQLTFYGWPWPSSRFFATDHNTKVTPTYMELFPHLTNTKINFFAIYVLYRDFRIQNKQLLMLKSEKISKLYGAFRSSHQHENAAIFGYNGEFLIQHKKLLMSTSEKIFKLRRTDVSVLQSF
jgi:hypothetical protein